MGNQGYGFETYSYIDGQRCRTKFARTIRPNPVERNGDFERRMDEMARMLIEHHGAADVELELRRQDGAIVECLVAVTYRSPRPEPITDDARPAGGRVAGRR
jgi:hypothetical protein